MQLTVIYFWQQYYPGRGLFWLFKPSPDPSLEIWFKVNNNSFGLHLKLIQKQFDRVLSWQKMLNQIRSQPGKWKTRNGNAIIPRLFCQASTWSRPCSNFFIKGYKTRFLTFPHWRYLAANMPPVCQTKHKFCCFKIRNRMNQNVILENWHTVKC